VEIAHNIRQDTRGVLLEKGKIRKKYPYFRSIRIGKMKKVLQCYKLPWQIF
jgi:hypothetical protein